MTKHITHQVNKIVYPFGDITDPITGKKVVGGKYRYDLTTTSKIFKTFFFNFKFQGTNGS